MSVLPPTTKYPQTTLLPASIRLIRVICVLFLLKTGGNTPIFTSN